jgi:hypothetical protein
MSVPATRPRMRHGFLAAALLVVAGLRAAEQDVPWAVVLAAAGLVEAALAVAGRRRARGGAPRAMPADPLPEVSVVDRSLAGHRRHLRLWVGCLVVCTAGALSVLASAPGLAAVLALLALVSLHRVRRARRSVGVLVRLTGPGVSAREGTT